MTAKVVCQRNILIVNNLRNLYLAIFRVKRFLATLEMTDTEQRARSAIFIFSQNYSIGNQFLKD